MFVSGATGALCSVVNGYYEPTEEKGVDGRVMYRKVGDGGVWIEHFEGDWARSARFDYRQFLSRNCNPAAC